MAGRFAHVLCITIQWHSYGLVQIGELVWRSQCAVEQRQFELDRLLGEQLKDAIQWLRSFQLQRERLHLIVGTCIVGRDRVAALISQCACLQ